MVRDRLAAHLTPARLTDAKAQAAAIESRLSARDQALEDKLEASLGF
jgi:hypothetical protein